MELTDEGLCERVAKGDDRAFDALVERYRERAWRVAWTILRDAEDARDASQEAFIRVHRSASTFRGRARFSTWFHRILVNACLDHQRRHAWWRRMISGASDVSATQALADQPAPDAGPDERLGRTDAATRLWAAVDRLPPQQRAAIVLQLEGSTGRDIAEALGCAEATARVHVHRALTALRKIMHEES